MLYFHEGLSGMIIYCLPPDGTADRGRAAGLRRDVRLAARAGQPSGNSGLTTCCPRSSFGDFMVFQIIWITPVCAG